MSLIERIKKRIQRLFKFILPNLGKLRSGEIAFVDYPVCNQITLITGEGNVKIGKGCSFGYKPGGFYRGGSIELQARYKNAQIIIGNNVLTNNNVFLCSANLIEIGDYTLIGQNVTIMDHDAHGIHPKQRRLPGKIARVIIGKNVWIGNNVCILKDSIIGDNTIVAAGAIVAGTFPGNVIIGGVPARIIKEIHND
jgi:acetyltransferase-like isoleucine patch superfamily enzyme